jgi:hypothetical protein
MRIRVGVIDTGPVSPHYLLVEIWNVGFPILSNDEQAGSYSGFEETQAGHSEFDAYATIKRHFRIVVGVKAHRIDGGVRSKTVTSLRNLFGNAGAAKRGTRRLFQSMFLLNSRRSDDEPSGRPRRSWIGVAPIRGPLGSAVRVDADALPTSSREISPDSDH